MKTGKKLFAFILISAVIVVSALVFAGCDQKPSEPDQYTIQYIDDTGAHNITVKYGDIYSIEHVPSRYGYDFLGLFDSEFGGVQYVSASGSSLTAFTDKKNMVLFPQFRAKEYTFILDYGEAQVTGSRTFDVAYDSRVEGLPTNLSIDYKIFNGWYTQPNCEGTRVADAHGVLPEYSKLTATSYDTTDPNLSIRLYAGFEWVKYTVTYFYNNSLPYTIKVEHGTRVNDIISETIDDKKVLSWSTSQNSQSEYTGQITGDIMLYAIELAPFIEFDSNGGTKVKMIIQKSGTPLTLPTPTKTLSIFTHWQTTSGQAYTATTMPSESIALTAKWNTVLTFDSNQGTPVNDIIASAGTGLVLPKPEREGFIFAGWYVASSLTDNVANYVKFTNTTMPANGVALKALWYKKQTVTKIGLLQDDGSIKNSFTVNIHKDIIQNYGLPLTDSEYAILSKYNVIEVIIDVEVKPDGNAKGTNEDIYWGVSMTGNKDTHCAQTNRIGIGGLSTSSYSPMQFTCTITNKPATSGTLRIPLYDTFTGFDSGFLGIGAKAYNVQFRNVKVTFHAYDSTQLY